MAGFCGGLESTRALAEQLQTFHLVPSHPCTIPIAWVSGRRPFPRVAVPTVLDYLIVTHGQLKLTLHDGTTKIVNAGDLVVQTAAVHQWSNETSEPARECQPAYFPAVQGAGAPSLSAFPCPRPKQVSKLTGMQAGSTLSYRLKLGKSMVGLWQRRLGLGTGHYEGVRDVPRRCSLAGMHRMQSS